jgi:hypothetical protein
VSEGWAEEILERGFVEKEIYCGTNLICKCFEGEEAF